MTVNATPFDTSLDQLLAHLAGHDAKSLVIDYADRRIAPGYHITEVKAGSFVALDCGGQPDTWQETVLQVEDIPAKDGQTFLSVGKFCSILAQVDRKVGLHSDARLTFEVSRPGEAMQVFDVAGTAIESDKAVLRLAARPAICKPRHRAAVAEAASCCAANTSAACCA
ncbi:DUF6428 family protein [Devosia nitrariae]|uniref:Uncharacterized protein n=1 Tax=Devosia nitrariae TaxID=2071872 RepID=A0ABQ5VZG1_9HYPH|nr:DUF6428 family protein [Devosia nitrariae]GLQ53184.1 hypothetical protein GCM10010862_04420 [Devosia nitrariae]